MNIEDGTPYRPSFGTEGMGFVETYCMNCFHEKFSHTQNHNDKKCNILARSFLYKLEHEDYPEEWIYQDGKPTCTKYQYWDWFGGPWGNDFQDPPPEPVDDPAQLMFPFMIDYIIQTETIEELVLA